MEMMALAGDYKPLAAGGGGGARHQELRPRRALTPPDASARPAMDGIE
jgi:hypothetical protein